jgi:hypothetical protein
MLDPKSPKNCNFYPHNLGRFLPAFGSSIPKSQFLPALWIWHQKNGFLLFSPLFSRFRPLRGA